MPATTMTAAAVDDAGRLSATAAFVREQDTCDLLSRVLPGLGGPELRALTDQCRFAHAAVLVFPPDEDTLRRELAGCALPTDAPAQPSVVVRERLAARHRRDLADLDVRILRPEVRGPAGEHRAVEVFALTVPPGSALSPIAADERRREHEAHLAFDVVRPDPLVLRGLLASFARQGAAADGGGYNLHEDGTVFYFTAPADTKTAYRRVELYASGDHRDVLAEHLGAHDAAAGPAGEHGETQPAETLLRLLTGAWTTQALAACAQLRLPEAMDRHTGTPAAELARTVGAHPESLATLLRYLAMLGVVRDGPDGFRLTGVGALLDARAPGSMRPLALMYGGPFYQSFAHLAHTVRSGQPGFEHLYGENHFDHFARHPELATLFDQSMVSSAPIFEPLPAHPVLTAAATAPGRPRTVVDIAGGTGELLGRILTAHPTLRGILLERPQVLAAARTRLAATPVGARCDFRPGDFADVPPGGDVYVLSRVLHDWDDDRCRSILRHCADAMPGHADLLVVERLLPADGAASLATAWDLHMMCNTGGRERTAEHYARLLADCGLALVGHTPLALGAHTLHARRT
ncbi:methyltransferase [Streptomyces sp. WM6373]|nr:methyltransferase [Streptomyces sp. WM6373]KOU78558.1 methyltransferase [Streptomyces sp. XY66]KOU90554.1 methyltransferase [Streptomyces sp. XY58]KOV03791.1 methyltransferase [Streptomyces sp. XY37]KOV30547.1 methyltransferase [Streptomyces sp. H021]KOV44165.1 methyltransferase [Streptomyces sp. MMG1064]